MAFSLKPHSEVFGIHEKTSQFGTPVILKDDLEEGVEAEANRDGTIFVNSKLYSADSVTWKKDTRSPARVYDRATMNEGHPDFEWEDEAYKQS